MAAYRTHRNSICFLLSLAALALLSSCDKDREDVRSEPFPPASERFSSNSVPVSIAPPSVQPVLTPAMLTAPEIRVAVAKDVAALKIGVPSSGARIVLNGQPWRQLPAGASVNITWNGTSILLDGQPMNASSVRFESFSAGAPLLLNDRETAASLSVTRPPNRTALLVVAQLSLEEYLAGVLAGEVPYERWHAEALRAQAVVSRTYAMYEVRSRAGEAYDVESTVMSQVFHGGYKNVPALLNAVESTRGQVLTTGGQPFPAYFHSTCGGHTECVDGVFPEHAGLKPLCGVACPYCAQSPAYRWRATFSKEQMAAKLRAQIPNLGRIDSMSFVDAKGAACGISPVDLRRVQSVSIKHSNGVSQIQGNAFRLAVGAKDLKSLLFGQVVDRGDALDIGGGGFGHGVGMCQYGSQGMALAGEPYTRILGLYFPGAALTRMY